MIGRSASAETPFALTCKHARRQTYTRKQSRCYSLCAGAFACARASQRVRAFCPVHVRCTGHAPVRWNPLQMAAIRATAHPYAMRVTRAFVRVSGWLLAEPFVSDRDVTVQRGQPVALKVGNPDSPKLRLSRVRGSARAVSHAMHHAPILMCTAASGLRSSGARRQKVRVSENCRRTRKTRAGRLVARKEQRCTRHETPGRTPQDITRRHEHSWATGRAQAKAAPAPAQPLTGCARKHQTADARAPRRMSRVYTRVLCLRTQAARRLAQQRQYARSVKMTAWTQFTPVQKVRSQHG